MHVDLLEGGGAQPPHGMRIPCVRAGPPSPPPPLAALAPPPPRRTRKGQGRAGGGTGPPIGPNGKIEGFL